MNTLPVQQPVLRFPGHEHPDLPLRPGINGLCRDPDFDRGLMITPGGASSLVEFCVDARGLWLHVAEGVRGVHLNGRPVQRLAYLHVGDTLHCEGIELQLCDPAPPDIPENMRLQAAASSRLLLRGHGGNVHGRAVALHGPLELGGDQGMKVEGVHLRLGDIVPLVGGGLLCRLDESAAGDCRVNGWPATETILKAGDQLQLAAGCRYLVESPGDESTPLSAPVPGDRDEAPMPAVRRMIRMPWMLLAAVASAMVLAALLWFGVR